LSYGSSGRRQNPARRASRPRPRQRPGKPRIDAGGRIVPRRVSAAALVALPALSAA
jgi:hypothetical protein